MQKLAGPLNSFGDDASVVNRPVKRDVARRALAFAAPYRGQLLTFLMFVICSSAIAVISPLIYREIINRGILAGDVALVVKLAALIAALGLVDAGLQLVQSYFATRIGAAVVVAIRVKLFERIQLLPLTFFERIQTGALASRLANDAISVRSAFTDILSNAVGNAVSVVFVFAAIAFISWKIALAVLVLLPLFLLPARYWGRRIQVFTREGFEAGAALNGQMIERFNVAGVMLAKLYGRPDEDAREFERQARRLSRPFIQGTLHGRLFAVSLTLMASFATALVYGWGGALAARRTIDLGAVVATVSLLVRVYAPLAGLSNVQVSVMTALVAFKRMFDILDLEPTILDKAETQAIPPGPIELEFDHVDFSYPTSAELRFRGLEGISAPEKHPARNLLKDIDFVAPAGRFVALVGPSGAGKTTITQLIPRLYDVRAGAVRVNGVDVRDAALNELRARIGVVSQDAHFFHATVRANLLYARPDATEDELWSALHQAHMQDVVAGSPNGLDTMIGERGVRLSGGERQRLAIARLFLKAPDLVVLDEATAHLDSASEIELQEALERALVGRTAIAIAHRLSTVTKADQILVVQDGRIVQRGVHSELMRQPGVYADLCRQQFRA